MTRANRGLDLRDARRTLRYFLLLYVLSAVGTATAFLIQIGIGARTWAGAIAAYVPAFVGWTIAFLLLSAVGMAIGRRLRREQ
ncbi:MAG TPA: hypothetical protein VNJ54_11255 [Plantibacter sp.]|uniref:hypothetical protein n=1 Tax=unclassified Plantibacter TaxID=2624265 RepID=UPI002C24BD5A|nr:hypothetical protein [Plantibacter sp.]